MQICYERIKKISVKNFLQKIPYRTLLGCVLCFLLARVKLYGDIAPLGLSFVAATFSGLFEPWTSLFYVLGLLSAGVGFVAYLRGLLALLLFVLSAYLLWSKIQSPKRIMPLFCGGAALIASVFTLLMTGFSVHQTITSIIFISVSSLATIAFSLAVPAISSPEQLKHMTPSVSVSVLILFSGLICSVSDITIGPFSVGTALCIFVCLCAAYKYSFSISTVISVFIGVAAGISLPDFTTTVCFFIFSTFFAAIASRLGKPWIPFSFLAGCALLMFYSQNSPSLINFYEIVIAGVIFLLIPRSFLDKINFLSGHDTEVLAAKQLSGQLMSLSETFLSLSDVFTQLCNDENTDGDSAAFIKRTVDQVCMSCAKKNFCFKSNAKNTFTVMQNLFSVLQQKGHLDPGDLPYDFSKGCQNRAKLTETMTHLYDLYRLELLWGSRVEDGRNAISGQMKSISSVFERLAEKKPDVFLRDSALEDDIKTRLSKNGITLHDICAGYDKRNRLEISLSLVPCGGNYRCGNSLEDLLSEITGRTLERCGLRNCQTCRLKYTEAHPWRVNIGKSCMPLSDICGDSTSFARLEDGRFVIALSDGMGTGSSAAAASNAAVKLAVRLLSAGIDINAAVSLINSVLVNKSADGPFATIDLVLINQQNGMCEFVKNGAAAGFIRHDNGKVDVIRATALPAGLLENLDIAPQGKKLLDGDILVLVTDGVLDADSALDKEARIIRLLSDFSGNDAQALASYLMNQTLNSGRKIKDDMTIITAKCINQPLFGNTSSKRRLQA